MRKYCSVIGCTNIVEHGRCAQHETPVRLEQRRHVRGVPGVNYGRRWQRAARAFLAEPEHIWCALCPPAVIKAIATQVDHIIPHEGDARLFWDRSNWQPLCKPCHSRKTARETLRSHSSL